MRSSGSEQWSTPAPWSSSRAPAHERARSPEQTRRDWRAQADALCRHLAALAPETPATLDGMETAVRDQVLARTLETWIHADDAARAARLRLPHPVPEHIQPTADLCARLLPWTMLVSGLDGSGRALHLTLTGPGGGEWHVPLGVADTDAREPEARITADVVEFCFLLGGRGEPESFAAQLEGDLGLARDVLRTAPALSGP
ncbi:maleylpyruvate isomerase N-terminal domain-containing protein [Nonomuraea sp. NPDC050691]|uniref:maleylpyruvate isomerase N-terminal domain-containing protein n=1 Tax=Nonomuraea sp. NPDC050691 TaxID=3155661 RepID=UPI0033DFA7FC